MTSLVQPCELNEFYSSMIHMYILKDSFLSLGTFAPPTVKEWSKKDFCKLCMAVNREIDDKMLKNS